METKMCYLNPKDAAVYNVTVHQFKDIKYFIIDDDTNRFHYLYKQYAPFLFTDDEEGKLKLSKALAALSNYKTSLNDFCESLSCDSDDYDSYNEFYNTVLNNLYGNIRLDWDRIYTKSAIYIDINEYTTLVNVFIVAPTMDFNDDESYVLFVYDYQNPNITGMYSAKKYSECKDFIFDTYDYESAKEFMNACNRVREATEKFKGLFNGSKEQSVRILKSIIEK